MESERMDTEEEEQRDPLDQPLSAGASTSNGGSGDLFARLSTNKVYLYSDMVPQKKKSKGRKASGGMRGWDEEEGDGEDDGQEEELALDDSTEEPASILLSEENPIRPNAIFLSGPPLVHLPTDKVFEYIGTFSPHAPLGIEWINDTNCVVVFHSARHALESLVALIREGELETVADEPAEAKKGLLERVGNVKQNSGVKEADLNTPASHIFPTHLIPLSLWPATTLISTVLDSTPSLVSTIPSSHRSRHAPKEKPKHTVAMDSMGDDGEDTLEPKPEHIEESEEMRMSLGARRARADDKKPPRGGDRGRGGGSNSRFYAKHGRNAGKPPSEQRERYEGKDRGGRSAGFWSRDRSRSPDRRGGDRWNGGGRDRDYDDRRGGRERREPAAKDDLDAELEAFLKSRPS